MTTATSSEVTPNRPALVSTALLLLLVLAAVMMTVTPSASNSRQMKHEDAPSDIDQMLGIPPAFTASPVTSPRLPANEKLVSSKCDVEGLRQMTRFDNNTGKWSFSTQPWCSMSFPLSGAFLRQRLKGKRLLFLGDSVVRNSFVVIMAKLCNEANMYKCIIRMPTHEYDMVKIANESGPMGCVPGDITPGTISQCYKDGKFAFVPLKGLTTRSMPKDRNSRRVFINKGLIGPAVHMNIADIDLIYIPVNRPNQISKTAAWIAAGGSYLRADYTLVSIGPHLKLPEVLMTPHTFNESLGALRRALGPRAPIVVAEFVHALKSRENYISMVDQLMATLSKILDAYDIALVPQRHVTRYGYQQWGFRVDETDRKASPPGGQCGYYDDQHPALRCQAVGTDLLLAAALSR